MVIDFYRKTGDAHQFCEDYICASDCGIFLSDGCSSAANSEIGSKILALTARKLFHEYSSKSIYSIEDILNRIIINSEKTIHDLNVDVEALFATLITLINQGKTLTLNMSGDGVAAVIKHDNTIEIFDIEFSANAPRYLAYRLSNDFRDRYNDIKYNPRICRKIIIKNGKQFAAEILPSYDDADSKTFCIDTKDVKTCVIFSDGVKSFLFPSGNSVPMIDIILDLINFKNTTNGFVQRRVSRFLQNKEKEGISHYDDLSVAAIYLG